MRCFYGFVYCNHTNTSDFFMDSALEKKILDDIKKNGFSLELKAGKIFRQRGWLTSHNYVYQDPDKKINREIDLYCNIGLTKFMDRYKSGLSVISEAKTSTKPWVFFCTPSSEHELEYAMHSMIKGDNYNEKLIRPLFKNAPRDKYDFVASSYYEAFKAYNEDSSIYKAINSCTKALYYFSLHAEAKSEKHDYYLLDPIDGSKLTNVQVFIPTVILDGQLIKATLNSDEEVEIEEVEYIPATHTYLDEDQKEHYYLVDIVTLPFVSKYLESLEKWFNTSTSTMLESRKLWNAKGNDPQHIL